MANELSNIAVSFPIVDIARALFFIISTHWSWAFVAETKENDSVEERTLGATVILAQLGAVITGVSIILAGIGAFVALEQHPIGFPQNYHLLYAGMWTVLALGTALFTMATLPTRTPAQNFVRSHGVAVLCSAALFFSLAAGARFLVAVWSILF